jgi:ribosome-associated toxin RatA of RatAB toxin-antitoxin module
MKTVHKSVLIWYSAAEMFALVTDIARYPEFLPWCDQASVLEEDSHGMTAKVGISFAGLTQSFTTRNTHQKDRKVSLKLVDGPFSKLDGHWDFTPVGKGGERACKVEFTCVMTLTMPRWPLWSVPCLKRLQAAWSTPLSKGPRMSMAKAEGRRA